MSKDTLTRRDLAAFLKNELDIKPSSAKDIVDGFFDEICQSLIDGEEVKLSGFGNFILRDKSERVGQNLHSGKEVKIPPRRVVVFRPSRKLRDLLQKDYRSKDKTED